MNKTETAILQYLQGQPKWHYGLDLVKAGLSNRMSIYIHLGRLEEGGWIESRKEPNPAHGLIARPQYRATGKREISPDSVFA